MFCKVVATCALSALAATTAAAQAAGDVARGEILTGWTADDGSLMAGVRIVLAPGWKTYWRAPGDAGIPPEFDWSASENVAGVAPVWPVPEIFYQNGMRSVGYSHEVVIPLRVRPADPYAPPILAGEVNLGVCQDVCLPVTLSLTADLPGTPEEAAAIREALSRVPVAGDAAGLTAAVCRTEPISDGLRVTASLTLPPVGQDEVAVLEAPSPDVWVSEAETRRDGRVLTAVAEMVPPSGQPFALDRSQVRITVLSGGRAVDIRGCTGG